MPAHVRCESSDRSIHSAVEQNVVGRALIVSGNQHGPQSHRKVSNHTCFGFCSLHRNGTETGCTSECKCVTKNFKSTSQIGSGICMNKRGYQFSSGAQCGGQITKTHKGGHLLKVIAEDVYQFLIGKDSLKSYCQARAENRS
ncbi:uncharacterized protein LOC142574587 [Dermacentor variabilis]|uniref:uncharacterized protein LOC142574587 n=1 Tax=Dermacentor variabilis TaxID=34621 RepID=UPI003F5C4AE9